MTAIFAGCALIFGLCIATELKAGSPGGADENGAKDGMRLVVDVRDGSHLIGVSRQESLPVSCSFGMVKIPLAGINKVTMFEDREQARFDLANGDHFTGIPGWKAAEITTIIGDIAVGMSDIRGMVMLGRPGAVEKGLVLWNTLGSEDEVLHSRVGPGGTFRGGGFTEGVQGNAFVAQHDQNGLVSFSREVIPVQAGCIELWARFAGIPNRLSWGANPWLFFAESFSMTLNGNDGNSMGGLCGSAGQLGSCATGTYGNWSYAQALESLNPGDWHHYALVWDKGGIKGIGDGSHTVAVFLDGRLNSKSWSEPKPNTVDPVPLSQGELALMVDQHFTRGTVTLDELKIWAYSKTDFRDAAGFLK